MLQNLVRPVRFASASLLAAACALVPACSNDAPPPAEVAQEVTTTSIGQPDGAAIMGAPAVARWTDGSTYVFVSALPGGPILAARRGGPQPDRVPQPPCSDCTVQPVPALYYRRLANGAWGPWTSLGGHVNGPPAAAATDAVVTQQDSNGNPVTQTPARIVVMAPGSDGFLQRCYLETAPEDDVTISIVTPTTFTYTFAGGTASAPQTIPVGSSFAIPGGKTDLLVSFPTPPSWQVPYRAGESYHIKPHQPIPVHDYGNNFPYDTPNISLQVSQSTWSACETLPIAAATPLALTTGVASSSSSMPSKRGDNGDLVADIFYSVDGESQMCSPSSKPTDQSCAQAWYDLKIPLGSAPTTLRSSGGWIHFFDINGGQLAHHAISVFAGTQYNELIPAGFVDPPAPIAAGGGTADAPALDLFGRNAAGQLVRLRNYSQATLAANNADGGIGGHSDGGVARSGYWTTDTFAAALASAPAALLSSATTIPATGASLRVYSVYAVQGGEIVERRIREIDNLSGLIAMPDSSCGVPYELQAKLTFCKAATTADMIDLCADVLDDIAQKWPAGSSCRATMRDFHFDIFLGLLDRALPFDATHAPTAATLATALGWIDAFWQLEQTLFADPVSSTPSPTAAHARRLAELFSQHAWASAENALETTLPPDGTDVGGVLEQMSRATITVDQQILQTLFADGAAPMTSPALLWIVADHLTGVAQRMAYAGQMHDFGCRFRDSCANSDSELDELWRATGALADPATLRAVLCSPSSPAGSCVDAATAMRADWKSVFTGILNHYDRLSYAAFAAVGNAGSPVAAAAQLLTPASTLPAIMQPLAQLVGRGHDVAAAYARRGLYDTAASDVIDIGIQEKNIATMLQTAHGLQTQFDKDLSTYKDKQRQYVLDQVTSLKAGGDVTLLQAHVTELKQQLEDLSSDVQGIRLASRSEQQRKSDFANELQALLDSRQSDPNMLISKSVDFPTTFTISADQMSHPFVWKGHLDPGDIVLVNVTGSWTPSCAINSWPYNHDPPLIAPGPTGPEGYAAYYESNQIDAKSNSYTQQHDDYIGNKTSESGYAGAGWDYIAKLGYTISGSFDYGSTDSQITANSDATTTESRASINMNTGLRLPNTPDENMPVGALLLESSWLSSYTNGETPAEPHFLERQTAFVAPPGVGPEYQQIILRFLVNDAKCDLSSESGGGGQLGVQLTVLQPQGALVKQLGQAMATVLGHMRDAEATYVKEGTVTPEEMASLRSTAFADLNTACNCDGSKFEASLLGFFGKWVDSELAEISRAVELTQRKRTIFQLATELDATAAELDAAKKQQALLTLLPVESLRGLAGRYLAGELEQIASYYIRDLYPIAKLRFPQTLTTLAATIGGSDDLSRLQAAAWDDAFVDLADRADRSAVNIDTQFDLSNPPRGTGMVRVIMRYPRDLSKPNPTDGSQLWHVDPSGPAYLFPHVEPFISTALWDEVMNGDGIAHLVVKPDDLYNALGGSARLDCQQAAPAIHDMVLVGVLPRSLPSDPNGYNAYTAGIWNVPLDVEPNVMYPTAAGPQSYVLDPSLTHYLPRVYFINEDKIDATLNSFQQWANDAASMEVAGGISPFGDFDFNLGAFRQQFQPPSTLKDPLLLISEWMLVFDLETKNLPTAMTWLASCATH